MLLYVYIYIYIHHNCHSYPTCTSGYNWLWTSAVHEVETAKAIALDKASTKLLRASRGDICAAGKLLGLNDP